MALLIKKMNFSPQITRVLNNMCEKDFLNYKMLYKWEISEY